jgi:hypothetical protein
MANKKARKTTTRAATTPNDKATMVVNPVNPYDATSP